MALAREFSIADTKVPPGVCKDIKIKITELYTATPLFIPVTVINGRQEGVSLFVMATLHGDELNGIEIVRHIRNTTPAYALKGRLILVGIANPISFINQTRDLPDGRDLNRAFPGSKKGSMASQIAYALFETIVSKSDYGIDIHSATRGRSNLPHIRADMRIPGAARIAKAFGTKVIFDLPGETRMLRKVACDRGIPTIAYEAGEPMKFESDVVQDGIKGIRNVMKELGMIAGEKLMPRYQLVVKEHKWIRAERGGILVLKVKPGDVVNKGDPIAFNLKPFGVEQNTLRAPFSGLVVGVTTVPMVIPGSAVAHILKVDQDIERFKEITRRIKLR